MLAGTTPAIFTTWWLWALGLGLIAAAHRADRRVVWHTPSHTSWGDVVLAIALAVSIIASWFFDATFPGGASIAWPLGFMAVIAGGIALRFASTAAIGRHFSGDLITEGQEAVDTGPYRWVRHPGYLGATMFHVGFAGTFAYWPPVLVAIVIVGWFVRRRIDTEEHGNDAGIKGYREYRQKVPSRLIPGVW